MADIHLRQPIRSKEDCHCKINHSDTLSETEKLSDKKNSTPKVFARLSGCCYIFPFDEITYIPDFATSQPSGSNPSSVCLYSLASFICHKSSLFNIYRRYIAIGKAVEVGTKEAVFFTCCYKGHEGQGQVHNLSIFN